MPEIKFDTEDYYDDETLQDMIESETQRYIREHVNDMMQKHKYWVPNFIALTAKDIVSDVLTEKIPGYKQQIAGKVQETIDEMEDYSIRYSDKYKEIMNECIEECRPIIKSKVDDVCAENLDANYIVDSVCDEFYNMLRKMLVDGEKF